MVLRAENVSKRYFRRNGQANHFWAVREASLALNPGEVTVLTGRSGSGKTTLLHRCRFTHPFEAFFTDIP